MRSQTTTIITITTTNTAKGRNTKNQQSAGNITSPFLQLTDEAQEALNFSLTEEVAPRRKKEEVMV